MAYVSNRSVLWPRGTDLVVLTNARCKRAYYGLWIMTGSGIVIIGFLSFKFRPQLIAYLFRSMVKWNDDIGVIPSTIRQEGA